MDINQLKDKIIARSQRFGPALVVAVLASGIGIFGMRDSGAATYVATGEAERGVLAGNVGAGDTAGASSGASVRFQQGGTTPPNPGAILFTGDIETGNLNQWPLCQSIAHNDPCNQYSNSHYSMKAVSSPKRQGNYSARFEVRDGDYPFCCGERAQVRRNSFETEGKDLWYSWSTMAEMLPSSSSFQLLFEWHSNQDGSPPVAFFIENNKLALRIHANCCGPYDGTRDIWIGPAIQTGQWQDIKMHIKWSQNSSVGFIELWHNGTRQTFSANPSNGNGTPCVGAIRCNVRTIHAGDAGNYLVVGYYREQNINGTAVVYHDDIVIASSEAGL